MIHTDGKPTIANAPRASRKTPLNVDEYNEIIDAYERVIEKLEKAASGRSQAREDAAWCLKHIANDIELHGGDPLGHARILRTIASMVTLGEL